MIHTSGVMVVAEVAERKPTGSTDELLGLARRLTHNLGGVVSVAVLGSGLDDVAQELIARGADRVYVLDDAALAQYHTEVWLAGLEKITQDAHPAAILFAQTAMGAEVAPRLAFRLRTAAATDCIEAVVQDGTLLVTRPCYGGKARAVMSFQTQPAIAAIQVKSQEPLQRDEGRKGEIVQVALDLDCLVVRTRVIKQQREQKEGLRLEEAEIVVAGGLGLKSADGFRVIEELAQVLGAAVGASRAACDLGWYPHSRQIGLTGKAVRPNLYIAVGISGASQHMAGCAGAKTIVAINPDPQAAVYQSAHFGVQSEYEQIVPALIEALSKR